MSSKNKNNGNDINVTFIDVKNTDVNDGISNIFDGTDEVPGDILGDTSGTDDSTPSLPGPLPNPESETGYMTKIFNMATVANRLNAIKKAYLETVTPQNDTVVNLIQLIQLAHSTGDKASFKRLMADLVREISGSHSLTDKMLYTLIGDLTLTKEQFAGSLHLIPDTDVILNDMMVSRLSRENLVFIMKTAGVSNKKIRRFFMGTTAPTEKIIDIISNNRNFREKFLQLATNSPERREKLFQVLSENPNVAVDNIREAIEAIPMDDNRRNAFFAEKNISRETLLRLVHDSEFCLEIIFELVKDSSIGKEIMLELVKDSSIGKELLLELVKDSSIGKELLLELVKDSSIGKEILAELVKDSSIGMEVWLELVKDSSIGKEIFVQLFENAPVDFDTAVQLLGMIRELALLADGMEA